MSYSWTLCLFYQNVSVETKNKIVYEMIIKLSSIIHNVIKNLLKLFRKVLSA